MPTLVRLIFALLALAAIGRQLILHVEASYSAVNFFSYFTNLSNIVAASVLLVCVFSRHSRSQDLVRYVSTVNMAVVGLVFAALLRDADLGALLPWVNVVLHYVMPVIVVADWAVGGPASKLNARHALLAFVFPAVYLVYVVVRGANTGWYPYPFLNPAIVGGYGVVAAYAIGITATFFLAGWVLLAIGNRGVTSRQRNADH